MFLLKLLFLISLTFAFYFLWVHYYYFFILKTYTKPLYQLKPTTPTFFCKVGREKIDHWNFSFHFLSLSTFKQGITTTIYLSLMSTTKPYNTCILITFMWATGEKTKLVEREKENQNFTDSDLYFIISGEWHHRYQKEGQEVENITIHSMLYSEPSDACNDAPNPATKRGPFWTLNINTFSINTLSATISLLPPFCKHI
jgi:hypothetical protein